MPPLPFRRRRRGRSPSGRAPSRRAWLAEPLEPRTLLSVQPLGPDFRVNTTTPNMQRTESNRSVASNAAGDFVAVWESFAAIPTITGQRFDAAGTKRGGEFQVMPPWMSDPLALDVAMDAAGNFVVVWANRSAPFQGIYSQRYNADGVPLGGASQIRNDAQNVLVAMDGDGDYVVVWEALTGFFTDIHWNVFAQRYDATGAAQGNFFPVNSGPGEHTDPNVAMDASGNFAVTWAWSDYNQTPHPNRLQARLFNAQGAPRGSEFDVTSTSTLFPASDVAMDATGDLVVAWQLENRNGPAFDVQAQRFNPAGTPVGAPLVVNSTTPYPFASPAVSTDAAGDFVAVWLAPDQVRGQQFHASGARDGAEFRVDTSYVSSTFSGNPSVAMDYDGDFVAAWSSFAPTNDVDVFARIFASPKARNTATGQVFHDTDANGAKDAGEPGLPGRTIYSDVNNNGVMDFGTWSSTTASGTTVPAQSTRRYVGPGAGPGAEDIITDVNVTLFLLHPSDGNLTGYLISPAGRRVMLFGGGDGGDGDNFNFTTFDDAAATPVALGTAPFSGSYRPEEPLSNFNGERLTSSGYWMLEIQNRANDPGLLVQWSLSVTHVEDRVGTDGAGNYAISLPTGSSTIRQAPQPDWVLTYPTGGGYTVTFPGGGQTSGGFDFGNAYAGVISGGVFNDINANGIDDAGERFLSGWEVFADLNHSGTPDASEPKAFTTTFGYSLRGIPLNTPVSLGVVPPLTLGEPWDLSTAPGPVTVTSAQPTATAPAFGGFRRGSLSGTVFDDVDADGARDPGEAGLPGWTVYLDVNNIGHLEGPVADVAAEDVPLDFLRRAAVSQITVANQVGAIRDLDITVDVTYPFVESLSIGLTSPSGRVVTLYDGSATGADMDRTTFDDQADEPISRGEAPFRGRFIPDEPLDSFTGENPNGVWKLSVFTLGRQGGTLNAWSLTLTTAGERTTTSNAGGGYAFTGLRPGLYTVREQPQPGWTHTSPDPSVTLSSGEDRGALDFANHRDSPTPRVTQVYARGVAWAAPFMSYLAAQGLGSAQYGFAIGGGAEQLLDLPWLNVDRLSIAFDAAVQVDASDLSIRGVNVANNEVTGFVYDPVNHVATWTLGRPFANDKVLLDLDGDAPAGVRADGPGGQLLDGDWAPGAAFPSGNGSPGGDFRYRFDVLPGNVNRVSSVLADDFSAVKARFFRSTVSPGSGGAAYTIFHDVDGNGSILANDFSFVKSKFFSSLPGPEPAALFGNAQVDSDSRPVDRDSFGAAAILD